MGIFYRSEGQIMLRHEKLTLKRVLTLNRVLTLKRGDSHAIACSHAKAWRFSCYSVENFMLECDFHSLFDDFLRNRSTVLATGRSISLPFASRLLEAVTSSSGLRIT